MDKNGYNPSILQAGQRCFLCGRTDRKLDRHEVFGGAFRSKSKRLGLWVLLCHEPCHMIRVHGDAEISRGLRKFAQQRAMTEYCWSVADWRHQFGKNYLD